MKKRLCAVLLVAVLLISLLPATAFAQEQTESYSIFDVEIPFKNLVDCQRTLNSVPGSMQQMHTFTYLYSGVHGTQIHKLVPDVIENSDDYYFRFSKDETGTYIVLTMYRYSDVDFEFVVTDDGYIQSYGEACFVYVADYHAYGTFVSFRDKEYHMCRTCSHEVNYPRDDADSLSERAVECILCGCGECFVIQGTHPTISQMESLPLKDGMVSLEHDHRYNSSGQCPCGERLYTVECGTGAFKGTRVEGLRELTQSLNPNDSVVQVYLQISEEVVSEAEAEAITQAAIGQELDFLDMSLFMVQDYGEPEDIGSDNDQLLSITLPYDSAGKDVTAIYRYHDGQIQMLTKFPNDDGEYFVATKQTITVYAKKFSTYAIGFTNVDERLEDVAYEYSVDPTFTVTIPAEVTLGQPLAIAASNILLGYDEYVKVSICKTSVGNNLLALQNNAGDILNYTVTADGKNIGVGDPILKGYSRKDKSVEVIFSQPDDVKFSGNYTGTVTFLVTVECDN